MFTSHVLTNLTLTTNLSSLSRLGVTIIVGGGGGVTSFHRVKLAPGRNQVTRVQGRSQTKGIILYSRFGGRGGHGATNNYMF